MKLVLKKHKLLTEDKLDEYPRYKHGYEDYDLGWMYGLKKNLVYQSVTGKLKVFCKEYDIAKILGKKPWDIIIRDLVDFIDSDKKLTRDLEKNDKLYTMMCEAAKKSKEKVGYILTRVYKKVGFSGYRYEEKGSFDAYYTRVGIEDETYKRNYWDQRDRLYEEDVDEFVLVNRTKEEAEQNDITRLSSVNTRSGSDVVIGTDNVLKKLLS